MATARECNFPQNCSAVPSAIPTHHLQEHYRTCTFGHKKVRIALSWMMT